VGSKTLGTLIIAVLTVAGYLHLLAKVKSGEMRPSLPAWAGYMTLDVVALLFAFYHFDKEGIRGFAALAHVTLLAIHAIGAMIITFLGISNLGTATERKLLIVNMVLSLVAVVLSRLIGDERWGTIILMIGFLVPNVTLWLQLWKRIASEAVAGWIYFFLGSCAQALAIKFWDMRHFSV